MKKIRKRFRQIEEDCQKLERTALSEKYRSEYSSWKNRKNSLRKKGLKIHPDFEDFADFLKILGPKPHPSYTLDRINNDDPEYAPDKVRWASKKTQTRNRSNTVKSSDGKREYSAAEIAEQTGTSIATIRRRIASGWPHKEVVGGRHSNRRAAKSPKNARARQVVIQEDRWPWLGPNASLRWEDDYLADRPSSSRFEYFENSVRDYLNEVQDSIDDEAPLLAAKLEGRLSEPDIQLLLDYRRSKVPLSDITEKRLAELRKQRNAHLEVLEKLETYRQQRGEFHYIPDWEDDDSY